MAASSAVYGLSSWEDSTSRLSSVLAVALVASSACIICSKESSTVAMASARAALGTTAEGLSDGGVAWTGPTQRRRRDDCVFVWLIWQGI